MIFQIFDSIRSKSARFSLILLLYFAERTQMLLADPHHVGLQWRIKEYLVHQVHENNYVCLKSNLFKMREK